MRQASLNRRLLVGAAGFIAVALVLATLVIGFVLHRFIMGQIDQRLDTQIVFLASRLTIGQDDAVALEGDANGPPFDRPDRGWYWQVMGPVNVLTSRSLHGQTLVVPPFHRPERERRPAPADAIGPGNTPLHFRIQPARLRDLPVTIVATAPKAAVMGPLAEAVTTLSLSLAVLGVALVLAVVFQVRVGLRPLERLRAAVAAVRTGRSERVPADQPLEVRPLVDELNLLLEQNAANLERARRHVANLAHGLKTPLATLGIALSDHEADPTGAFRAQLDLMERRIRHHLTRARVAALAGPVRARTEIGPRIADIGLVLGKVHADRGIALTLEVPDDLAVACEPQDFDEMAGNLLENAFKWARNSVVVRASAGGTIVAIVAIVIEDDGPGLQPEQIPQALRPGARIDESAPGFGFGLPITRELAELYGGDVRLEAADRGGLRATLHVPRAG
jgi:signal transduction histidine kinase